MDNCTQSTKIFLKQLKIKSTKRYLRNSIESHPDHPSLLAISDTLQQYSIDTLAVKIDYDKLKEMPMPSLVQLMYKGQSLFYVLQNVFDDKVVYYNDNGKRIEALKVDFLKEWTGVCLLAETTENSKEKNIEKKYAEKRIKSIITGTIGVCLFSWAFFSFLNSDVTLHLSSTLFAIAYTALKVIGLVVGVFLLWYDVDQFNPALQNFCSGGNNKINCNAVLGSKNATIFNGHLTISLLSFSYFFGTFFFLLIQGFSLSGFFLVGALSIASFPIVLISLYYQAIVIKQWCRFCILIQIVLFSEIGITYFSNFYEGQLLLETIPLLTLLLFAPTVSWKFLKPLIDQEKETNLYKRGLKKLKNNPDVLKGLLLKSRKIATTTEGLGISIKNVSAAHHVIKVCNPYCGPCAKAHPVLEELVKAGKINLQMLFTSNVKPVAHFLAIDHEGDTSKTQRALDEWYLADQKDYEVFAHKYPMNGELALQNEKIAAMNKWCEAENITHTPTLFINGHELPKQYSIDDLSEVLRQ